MSKTVLILGANSDVAKQAIVQYVAKSYKVIAASRNIDQLTQFVSDHSIESGSVETVYFDAVDFASHQGFYKDLSAKPNIVVYTAGVYWILIPCTELRNSAWLCLRKWGLQNMAMKEGKNAWMK